MVPRPPQNINSTIYTYVVTRCPKCGLVEKNRVTLEMMQKPHKVRVTVCDAEDGGCDSYYGFRLPSNIETKEIFAITKTQYEPEKKCGELSNE